MRRASLWLTMSVFGAAVGAGQIDPCVAVIGPVGVDLGMTREELQASRPDARELPSRTGSRNVQAITLSEVATETSPAVVYQYHVVDEHLRALTEAIGGRPRDETKSTRMHRCFDAGFAQQADEKVVRLDDHMNQVIVTARVWKNTSDGTLVYVVDTPRDTSIVVFDPKYFDKKDFFIDPEEMPSIEPSLEKLRTTIGQAEREGK